MSRLELITPKEFGLLLNQRRPEIQSKWLKAIREQVPATSGMVERDLIDSLPKYLSEVSEILIGPETKRPFSESLKTASEHGAQRSLHGYSTRDVAVEYTILREILLSIGTGSDVLSRETVQLLNRINDAGLINATEEFLHRTVVSAEREARGLVEDEVRRERSARTQAEEDVRSQREMNAEVQNARAAAEFARRELHDFFMRAPEPMVMLLGPEHVFALANPPYIELIGRDPIGRKVRDVFSSEERGNFFELLDQVYQTGVPYVGKELPFKRRGANGTTEERWLNIGYYPSRDRKGHTSGILAFIFDVTEQVNLRKEIEISRAQIANEQFKLDQIFRNSPAAMATWSGEGLVFERVNPEYQKIFAGRELVGKPLVEACPELQGQGFDDLLREVLHTGKPFIGQEVRAKIAKYPGGPLEDRYYDFTYVQIKDSTGKPYGVYDHAVDVTETVLSRRKLEQSEARVRKFSEKLAEAIRVAESANSAKSAFLANMSHEIRSPLGAIMGFADLARQPDVSAQDIALYLSIIDRNTAQVLRIVDDILDLAKVEAGKISIEKVEFSLMEFLAEFSSLMEFRARENGITFEITAQTPLPERICTDPTRLRQILINAVGNAIKFTSKGFVKLYAFYRDRTLEFAIIDTGRGIASEQAERLFQAFVQADSSTTRMFGGTGLGLVLTKYLCQLLGGDYTLESSELGVGSKFFAKILIDVPASARMIPQNEVSFTLSVSEAIQIKPGRLNGLRILLVEDSPDNQMLVRLMLEKQGAELKLANDGVEGVKYALAEDFDVVLMDIQMPRMAGHEAVRTLRDRGYEKPVIALTAHAMKEETARAFESGFTDFISKPIHREELIEAVAKFKKRRQ